MKRSEQIQKLAQRILDYERYIHDVECKPEVSEHYKDAIKQDLNSYKLKHHQLVLQEQKKSNNPTTNVVWVDFTKVSRK